MGLVPLVNPVDHAEEGEGGGTGADAGFGSASALHVGDRGSQQSERSPSCVR